MPPHGIITFSTWGVPFLNTIILVLSGFTVTWAHKAICISKFEQTRIALLLTIFLAIMFTNLQICEYIESSYNIKFGCLTFNYDKLSGKVNQFFSSQYLCKYIRSISSSWYQSVE